MSVEVHLPSAPWLGQVIPAAAQACGADLGPAPSLGIPEAKSVIVIVVDGLGWHNLNQWKAYAPTLRPFLNDGLVLNTCLPSTTAAALTSLTTGGLPGETNMVGYSVAMDSQVMNLLQFNDRVDAAKWQPLPTFFERLAGSDLRPVVISRPRFAGSGLTLASMRGSQFMGAEKLEERFTLARRAAEIPSLIYLYWSEIDHAGHGRGAGSEEWLAELEAFDAALRTFLANRPRDTSVVLVADHGMVNVEERLDIADNPHLSRDVEIIAGEGRCVHVHARPGYGDAVRQTWKEELRDLAEVIAPEQYSAVFGEGPGTALLGDAVAFLRERTVIVDSRSQTPSSIAQVGVHGSFSPEETEIPLLILT